MQELYHIDDIVPPRAIVGYNQNEPITLTTDFGLKDGYVGVMKGVIWRIAPQVQIADITHQISPQNILRRRR